jgi:hypothetical protein
LRGLAQRKNCTVIVVRHLIKDASKGAKYRGGGSIGLMGAARSATLVAEDPADRSRCIMVRNKGSWSKPIAGLYYRTESITLALPDGTPIETSRISWEGSAAENLTADDILQTQVDVEAGNQVDLERAGDLVRQLLSDGPMDSQEIYKAGRQQGMSKKLLNRVSTLTGIIVASDGNGGFTWQLSKNSNEDSQNWWTEGFPENHEAN